MYERKHRSGVQNTQSLTLSWKVQRSPERAAAFKCDLLWRGFNGVQETLSQTVALSLSLCLLSLLDGSQPMLIWSDGFSPEPHARPPSGGALFWRTFCLLSCVTSGCVGEEAGSSASALPDDAVMLYMGLKSSRMHTSGSVISCILILSRGKAMICLSAQRERARCPLGPPIQHWSRDSHRPRHCSQITHLRSHAGVRPCWLLPEGGPGENNWFGISH